MLLLFAVCSVLGLTLAAPEGCQVKWTDPVPGAYTGLASKAIDSKHPWKCVDWCFTLGACKAVGYEPSGSTATCYAKLTSTDDCNNPPISAMENFDVDGIWGEEPAWLFCFNNKCDPSWTPTCPCNCESTGKGGTCGARGTPSQAPAGDATNVACPPHNIGCPHVGDRCLALTNNPSGCWKFLPAPDQSAISENSNAACPAEFDCPSGFECKGLVSDGSGGKWVGGACRTSTLYSNYVDTEIVNECVVKSFVDPATAKNGDVMWHFPTLENLGAASIQTDAGKTTAFFGDKGGNFYAVEPPTSGNKFKLKWQLKLSIKQKGEFMEEFLQFTPSTVDRTNHVWTASANGGRLYKISISDGKVACYADLRARHGGGGFQSRPSIAQDGTVYIGSGAQCEDDWEEIYDDKLYAVNPDCSVKWVFAPDDTSDTKRRSFTRGVAVDNDGHIYATTQRGCIYKIKDAPAPDGKKYTVLNKFFSLNTVWNSSMADDCPKHNEMATPVSLNSDGTVYAGSNNGMFFAFKPGTFEQKWLYHPAHYEIYQMAPVRDGNVIYLTMEDSKIYALYDNPTTGKVDVLWIWSLPVMFAGYTEAPWADHCTIVSDHKTPTPNKQLVCGTNHKGYFAIDITDKNKKPTGLAWKTVILGVETTANPNVDKDGTVYAFGGVNGCLYGIKGSMTLDSASPWPRDGRNTESQGNLKY